MSNRIHPPAGSPSLARQVLAAMRPAVPSRGGHAAAGTAGGPDRDDIPDQILAALRPRGRRVRVFDIGTAAVIGAAGVEGRVRVRIDDGRWSLATLEASLLAVLLTVDPGVPHGAVFADAFRIAAVMAEDKVEAVHAQTHGAAA